MANILTTKDDVKLYLEDIAGTSQFDALLDAIILAVSQRFELAANRKLFTATHIELHNGGHSRIYVKNPPVTAITSITYAWNYDFDNGTLLLPAEYILDPSDKKNVIYSTYGTFIGGEDTLKVVYVGGYISADSTACNIPDTVKNAAAQQVVFMFKNRKNPGFDNILVGDGTIHKVTNNWFLPEVMDVIKQLRVRNIY